MLPKEVCFLAGTLGQGGAERQLFYMLRSLDQSGVRLQVLSLTKGEFWEERIREMGIPVLWVGQQESRLVRLARIVKALRKHPPDMIQSQHLYTNLYVVAAARALGVREIGALRNNGVRAAWTNSKAVTQMSLRSPRVLAVNSRTAMRNALAMGVSAKRLHFLPNVVDTDQFQLAARQERHHKVLIAIGRLGREKRLDRFLSILARLRKKTNTPFRGMIIGAGPCRARLEQQARDLGLLPEVIEFKGSVHDIEPIYQQADILVLTSDYEGTPNVILEAMASGLPVVATRAGGVPDVVQHSETGYLADPEDEDSMVDALLALINDAQLRKELGSRARKYIEANHSAHKLPVLLEGLYSEAVS